jgi:hypothetical protein
MPPQYPKCVTTRCKFQVQEVARTPWPVSAKAEHAGKFVEKIKLTAVYDDGLSKENKSFADATPTGELSFSVTNPNVVGSFVPGDYFYLDLIPIPAGG